METLWNIELENHDYRSQTIRIVYFTLFLLQIGKPRSGMITDYLGILCRYIENVYFPGILALGHRQVTYKHIIYADKPKILLSTLIHVLGKPRALQQ